MRLEPILLPIKKELELVEEDIKGRLNSDVQLVSTITDYVVKNGGKRLRPAFCILSSKMAGYNGPKTIYCSTAIEFAHTATLLHDDVIDEADTRRGKPSTNYKWGNQTSVLIGDFFFCRASDILISGTKDIDILKILTDAMTKTTEGETLEITKTNMTDTTKEDYLKIITNKTAYIFSASCEIGGILGNISKDFVKSLKNFGLNAGIAFQLADDALDYVSDEKKFGKSRGTDLKEGKLTLPLIIALKKANEKEKRIIKDAVITERVKNSLFNDVVKIIERHGGIEYTLNLARSYANRAVNNLEPFKASIEKETLISLASYAVDRDQ